MTTRSLAAVLLAPVALALCACGAVDLAAYEHEEFSACYVDQGAWAGEPRAARYVQDSFDDFDRHFGPFLDDLEQAANGAAFEPPTRWSALHAAAQANIARLGRLLPRLNRPLDLAPMAGQFEEGAIWWPRGNHHTEFLRVALAEELARHQNLADPMAAFLARFERLEALLLDLKYPEAVDEASAGTELAGAAQQLREGWETVEPGMRRVIFDRRDMPQGESLPERLRARVTAICEGYSVCDGGQGCGDGSASSGLTGEPMEGP